MTEQGRVWVMILCLVLAIALLTMAVLFGKNPNLDDTLYLPRSVARALRTVQRWRGQRDDSETAVHQREHGQESHEEHASWPPADTH